MFNVDIFDDNIIFLLYLSMVVLSRVLCMYNHVVTVPAISKLTAIRYDTIRYDTIRYDTIRYDTIR